MKTLSSIPFLILLLLVDANEAFSHLIEPSTDIPDISRMLALLPSENTCWTGWHTRQVPEEVISFLNMRLSKMVSLMLLVKHDHELCDDSRQKLLGRLAINYKIVTVVGNRLCGGIEKYAAASTFSENNAVVIDLCSLEEKGIDRASMEAHLTTPSMQRALKMCHLLNNKLAKYRSEIFDLLSELAREGDESTGATRVKQYTIMR